MGVRAFAGGGRCAKGVLRDAREEVGTRASVRRRWVRAGARGAQLPRSYTNKKFQRLTWGLASLCQAPTPPRLRALTRGGDLSRRPGGVRVGLRRPGPDLPPRPPLPRARRSPRASRSTAPGQPGLDRARVSSPGRLGLGAGRPGGGLTPWEPGLRDPGRWRRPGASGGGGGQRGGEGAEARRRRARAAAASPRASERCAPRPGSHASHVRPLGAAAPRRRPRRVMRTDVKLPYEY